MANRKHTEEDTAAMEAMTSGGTPRDPGTGEVSVTADRDALNRRALPVEGMEPGEARPRSQAVESVGEPVRMVKDGHELSVELRDVEAHRRMGWGFAR